MARSMFVDQKDGYTLEGRVEELPGLHPEIRFKYRPSAGPTLQDEYARGGMTVETAAKIMARQASEFAPVGDDGKPEAPMRLAPKQCLDLHSNVWRAVWAYIMGSVGPYVEQEKNSEAG